RPALLHNSRRVGTIPEPARINNRQKRGSNRRFLRRKRWLCHLRGRARGIQNCADGRLLAPNIAKSYGASDSRGVPSARDAADVVPVAQQRCSRGRGRGGGKLQLCEAPVDVPAGADALDDFLSRIATLFVVDVGLFQAGLVRDLLIAVVG